MGTAVFPTKGNLIAIKKSLKLSQLGFDLLDRKRNILISELMQMVEKAKLLQGEIEQTYKTAYSSLEKANMTLGLCDEICKSASIETGVDITYRSVMGVDIPEVSFESTTTPYSYGLFETNSQFDLAYANFTKAKEMTIMLAEVENCVYRLANAINNTGRRANALKNINIPRFEGNIKFISNSLEEKEREEFSRLKVIRSIKAKKYKKYKKVEKTVVS